MATHTFQLPHRSSRAERRSLSRERKRKRREEQTHDEESASDEEEAATSPKPNVGLGVTRLTANQAAQYRTAGLSPYEDVAPHPFPHGAAEAEKPRRQGRRKSRTGTEIDDVDQEVGASRPGSTSLRQRHINVMTAIMHRCLLDGDFERAGKAWSLLLRSSPPLDVRRHDQWGIGAEILMRTGGPGISETVVEGYNDNSDSDDLVEPPVSATSFHEDGLRAARAYYDMLIRRFPAQAKQSNVRHLPNANEFQPVMLNVWLFQVAFTRSKVLKELDDQSEDMDGLAVSGGEADGDAGVDAGQRRSPRQARLEELRIGELREAELISAKLEELFRSPAFDRDLQLRHLHAMVRVWIEDLQPG